jgi:hypothetical protein
MELQKAYTTFLASPNTQQLADDASLYYITTLSTFNDATTIVKHLTAQSKQLKKKAEKVLNVVEASNALVLETSTTLEFVSSGGAYLPGLDDNFLADRTVTFPIVSSNLSTHRPHNPRHIY